jgi:chitin synthase
MSTPIPPTRVTRFAMEEASSEPSQSGPIMPGIPEIIDANELYQTEVYTDIPIPARTATMQVIPTRSHVPPTAQPTQPTNQPNEHAARRPPRQAHPELLSPSSQNGRPFAIPKRSTTVRRVELTSKGNLQVDIPVPAEILENALLKSGKEVEYVRYTAATCDADQFPEGYTLRASNYGRQTEIMIVVTMYNEDQVLFARTMHALFTNLTDFLGRESWGPDSWKRIVVCIVSDGRRKVNPGVLNVLSVMGCYQDGVAKNDVGGKPVAAHIFEYTTQIDVDSNMNVTSNVPMQVIFCLKEENAKKINSHRWFFNAFCPLLKPNVTILVDVGTRPLPTSLFHLWNVFDRHPNVGGACGEIQADISPGWSKALTNPIVAAQNFEYKISNTFDKPLESAFGYISVLPGAFSAYRYEALRNYEPGKGPLASYFRGEDIHSGKEVAGVFENNMFLAEDRILCFELVCKPGEAWRLRYESKAAAITDVPEQISELVSQRRRWLNGSTFAAVHAIGDWGKVYRSGHSLLRKIAFTLELIYIVASQVVSFLMLGNFYLIFHFLLVQNVPGLPGNSPPYAFGPAGYWVAWSLDFVYFLLIVVMFIVALGNRPAGSKTIYRMEAWLWAFLMGVTLYLIGWTAYSIISAAIVSINDNGGGATGLWNELKTNYSFTSLLAAFASTWIAWAIAGLLFLTPWHMLNSFVQFMLLSPFWVNVLQVYANCNINDVAWGTKGDDKKQDLPSAPKVQGEVVLELPDATKSTEASEVYREQLALLKQELVVIDAPKRDAVTKREDDFKIYRTVVLLVWVIANAVLVAVMTNPVVVNAMKVSSGAIMNPYLIFLFYIALAFGIIKMAGVVYYLFVQQLLDYREKPTLGNTMAKRPEFSV